MKNLAHLSKDYERIEKAIEFLVDDFQSQPNLEVIAQKVGLSEFHFQKLFQRWAGISPKKFVQFLTKEHAKELLKKSSLMEASYDSGLSGPSRLHDLFITWEAMSPGEYKQKGRGLTIEYGFHPSPFGECFIAQTNRGICSLIFVGKSSQTSMLQEFSKKWSNAKIIQNQKFTQKVIDQIFNPTKTKADPIRLAYQGTHFQIKVWEALLKIPKGSVVTYQTIAKEIHSPKAVRAVGTAIGANPIAYLIPCHRVIRGMGEMGGYRWGVSRKRAILTLEAANF
jgi:AraC family transcriptional regulator of adaptative response/methylated-DNA-[protein]-cysteine methyltransferase